MLIKISNSKVLYEDAMEFMENHITNMIENKSEPLIWLLEHPEVYTAGTSANENDLINPAGIKVYKSSRGGQYTYHGPGQRVVYLMIPLSIVNNDLKKYVSTLESIIIDSLATVGVKGETRKDRIGVWVDNEGSEKKIAAIGIRVRKYFAFHGFAINICPNLDNFKGIIPCGIREYGITSLKDLGINASVDVLDSAIIEQIKKVAPNI